MYCRLNDKNRCPSHLYWGYIIPNIVMLDDVYPGVIEVKSISVMCYSKMKNISSEISIPILSEANRACRQTQPG